MKHKGEWLSDTHLINGLYRSLSRRSIKKLLALEIRSFCLIPSVSTVLVRPSLPFIKNIHKTFSMNENRLIIDSLKKFLPTVENWIKEHLKENTLNQKKISDFGFHRLQYYFPKKILDRAKIVVVDKPEMIPLAKLGVLALKTLKTSTP